MKTFSLKRCATCGREYIEEKCNNKLFTHDGKLIGTCHGRDVEPQT